MGQERREPPEPEWAQVAYRLWRRGWWDWVQISALLAMEGWAASPSQIAAVVLERVGREHAS